MVIASATSAQMICDRKDDVTHFQLTNEFNCAVDIQIAHTSHTSGGPESVHLGRPNFRQYQLDAVKCTLVIETKTTAASLWNVKRTDYHYHTEAPTIEECNEMKEHRCHHGILDSFGGGVHRTANEFKIAPRIWPFSMWPQTEVVTNCITSATSVWLRHGQNKLSCSGADISSCSYDQYSCRTPNATIVWPKLTSVEQCTVGFFKTLPGRRHGNIWASDCGNYVLTIISLEIVATCGPYKFRRSNEGMYFELAHPARQVRETGVTTTRGPSTKSQTPLHSGYTTVSHWDQLTTKKPPTSSTPTTTTGSTRTTPGNTTRSSTRTSTPIIWTIRHVHPETGSPTTKEAPKLARPFDSRDEQKDVPTAGFVTSNELASRSNAIV
jgi:hypothetical protein